MTCELVVSAFAETDLREAAQWYNRLRPNLGDDLVLCVEQAFDRTLEHPEAFPMILPEVRRVLVRRFPYGVFFRVRQHRVEVEAVFHLRSDPARLWQRLHPDQDPDTEIPAA
jgi:toxin ParE1/3/4